jgi:hypothetical protein
VAAATPQVRRLVTRVFQPALAGVVDLWCEPVYLVDVKPGTAAILPDAARMEATAPAGERERRGAGAVPGRGPKEGRRWWYQSCLSHGCDGVGDGWFTGWPSLVIDAPPVAHRVLEWSAFRNRIDGELYFNTVEAYVDAKGAAGDPWRDQHRHGGNGDGTLLYPGTPARIGGRTDIPVESVRLKRLRDGIEDHEYLALYAARAGFAVADALAARVAEHAWRFDRDPAHLLAVRAELARRLDALAGDGGDVEATTAGTRAKAGGDRR